MKGAVNDDEVRKLDELVRLLKRRNAAARAGIPDTLKGLPEVDVAVVGLAASHPGLLVGEIAQELRVPNSTRTSSLNRLEGREIVQRAASPRDQRAFGVSLTEKGAQLHQAHADREWDDLERILAKLDTHEERELLFYLLTKMTSPGE
jgi:DNA-binding MarR family transcriptional regulator